MRTLTTPATTQKNRRTGAAFTRILEVFWDGPDEAPTLYGDAPLTLPGDIEVIGAVRSWGAMTLQAEPGRVGGHQQVQFDLHDEGHQILAHLDEDVTGPRTVRVYLWFAGTSWATDRVCLFAGTISGNIEYDDSQAIWQISAKGAETLFDKSVGVEINRKSFPQILCNQCDGEIIPVIFGANVRRIPTCPLGRPPATMLTRQLNILDDHVYLSRSVADMGLEFETAYTITVGYPAGFETLTIVFHEVDQPSSAGSAGDADGDSVAEILSRSTTLAAGTSLGPYGEDGLAYFTIAESDLAEPDRNLSGFMLVANLGDDGWQSFAITHWIDSGNGRAIVIEPENLDFTTGQLWKILSTPGVIPMWPVGTPVNVGQDWTFVVSHLPLESVDLVEVRGKPASGADQLRYYELAEEDYEVTLDNKSFNASLGRGEDDPGVSTVSINFAPSQWGGDEDTLFVTATAEQTAPLEVLTELLQNEWLGGIDSEDYPVDTTGAESDSVPAFALTQSFKLHETVSDLAQQLGLVYFWDGGKICIRTLKEWSALGDAVHSVDESNFLQGSFRLRVKDGPEQANRLVAKWKPSCSSAKEFRYIREAPAAIEIFGEKNAEVNFWAFQDKASVGDAATRWLRYLLGRQREVVVTGFLDGLQVQPMDTVAFDRNDAADDAVIVSTSGMVTALTHTPADAQTGQMETIEYTIGFRKQTWAVLAVPDDQECSIENGTDVGIPEEEHDNDPDTGDVGLPPFLPLDPSDPGIPTPNHPGWPQPPGSPDGGGGNGGGGGGGGGGNYGDLKPCYGCGDGSADESSGGSSGEDSSGGGDSGPCLGCPLANTLHANSSLGGPFELTATGGNAWSNDEMAQGGGFGQFILNCHGDGTWTCTINLCAGGIFPVTVNSCHPLNLTAHITEFYPGCGWTGDVTITE